MIVERRFAPVAGSVTAARHFVAESLRDVDDEISQSAALIVSELATNAVQHAETAFLVMIDLAEDKVSCEVTDAGGGEPEMRAPTPDEHSGRGLRIVDALAAEWGVVALAHGKTVWFSFPIALGAGTAVSSPSGY